MEFRDYYQDLGVTPDADEAAVKRAYRKLARQHHPDVNPDDKAAESRFKVVNEAYEVLRDSERRRKYDELRAQYQQWQKQGANGSFGWDRWQTGSGRRGSPGSPFRTAEGADRFEDLFEEDSPFSDFFRSIFGWQDTAQASRSSKRSRHGRDVEARVEITLVEAFAGAARSLQVDGRRIQARIPAGVRTGSRVRLQGQGETGRGTGQSGHLYLVVEVMPDPRFDVEGDDLLTDVPVDFYVATLGGEVRVPTLEGAVKLKIPAGTQSGRTFRLRGQGMPRAPRSKERGDLIARIEIVLPDGMSESEIRGLRELREKHRAE
ncbi:MAG: DnaJ domain-containing protein [Candidatus Eisenbacteria bacterium]|uniref:DnaJ domain-containing protein n=1 Tax=Eiseniibacteriota bacterium TaxID=2212470 RepID=A0A956LVW3_UNCEI|nr:DnaJ domain-containing protein [Candidatus Eisenbacteria bacterium]